MHQTGLLRRQILDHNLELTSYVILRDLVQLFQFLFLHLKSEHYNKVMCDGILKYKMPLQMKKWIHDNTVSATVDENLFNRDDENYKY